jgi:cell wall-associated NlpC family hydrolase
MTTATGARIVEIARSKLGQKYVFGARAKYDDPAYAGPWDCAEFATYCVAQAGGPLFGVSGRTSKKPDAYSGAWARDARQVAGARIISIDDAARIPGAILVRAPGDGARVGHVAISTGDGDTIEAMSPKDGVRTGSVKGSTSKPRHWTLAVLPPGIEYTAIR